MIRHFMHCLAITLLAATVFLPTHSAVRAQKPGALLVIVSASIGLSDISSASLRRAFQGYPTEYHPGKRLLPLNHATGSAERTFFDQTVLGLSPGEVGRFWIDQKVRGASQPPRSLPSASLAVRVVASFPGAITYTYPNLVRPGLTVLSIDGKRPTDSDYFLAR